MTKTIILTDLVIDFINIDYQNQRVLVSYRMTDDQGVKWETGDAIFWVNMPINPTDHDFLLPPEYIPTLLQLKADADQALTNKFLV